MITLVLALLSMLVIGSGCCVRATNEASATTIGVQWRTPRFSSCPSVLPYSSGRSCPPRIAKYASARIPETETFLPPSKFSCRTGKYSMHSERERRQGTEVLELREERQNKKVIT